MLSLQESVYVYNQGLGDQDSGERKQRKVRQLFWKVLSQGMSRMAWNRLRRKENHLYPLDETREWREVISSHAGGVQNVPIARIIGSEGRCQDFDVAFRPTNTRTEERWVNIATARELDIALPPVELIQVGEDYYVRDGHHRISVAKWNGQMEIEAQVTKWEV